jgi:hypothetical protein
MTEPTTISVLFAERDEDASYTAELQVEEFHPYEPAAYVRDPGWSCWDAPTGIEYFVSQTGDVYRQPENKRVGIAPVIAGQCNRMEAQISEAMQHE